MLGNFSYWNLRILNVILGDLHFKKIASLANYAQKTLTTILFPGNSASFKYNFVSYKIGKRLNTFAFTEYN